METRQSGDTLRPIQRRAPALTLMALIFLQAFSLPLQFAAANNDPPAGPGNWTVNGTVHLDSQTLIQGDVDVYGTLVIDQMGLYIWGGNDHDREIIIHNGGRVEVYNNSVISSYASSCFDFKVLDGGELHVQGGVIQNACSIEIYSRSEITLNQTTIEKSRIHFQMPGNTCDTSYDININGLSIRNQSRKAVSGGNEESALDFETGRPICSNTYVKADTIHINDLEIINICENCIGISIDEWHGDIKVDGFSSYEDQSFRPNVNYYDEWWPVIYIADDLPTDNFDRRIEFRNSTVYNQSHTLLFEASPYNNDVILLDNLSAWNLINPNGDDLGNNNSDAVSTSNSRFLYRGSVPRQLDSAYHMSSGDNRVFGAHLISTSSRLIMSNVHISDVWSNASKIANFQNNGQGQGHDDESPFWHGLSVQCIIIRANQLYADNLTVTNTCNTHVSTNLIQPSREAECVNNMFSSYGEWNPSNSSWRYLDPQFYYGLNQHSSSERGNEFVGISLQVEQTLKLNNSIILDNNRKVIDFTSGSSNCYNHGQVRTHGLLFGYITGMGDSASELEIENTVFSNNSRGVVAPSSPAHNCLNQCGFNFHEVNSEILIDNPAANLQYFWINDSAILTHDCQTTRSTKSAWFPYFCYPVINDGPVITITSTQMHTPRGPLDLISGEVIRRWNLEVRVTDPDFEWTPNASVTVLETNLWNLGTQSTGPLGGSVNFDVKEYSRSSTNAFTYTPHTIEVTMENYTNSTSVSVNGDTSVVVYDPTPDAFPGDVTQDWDADGDGYGDNLTGNNPDLFPSDPTQWNDTDGDGHGDNYAFTIDNATGLRVQTGDAFMLDPTQWSDLDGDGHGDNYTFSLNPLTNLRDNQNGDAFIHDPTQWSDLDGDGYGDEPTGNSPDWNSTDPTQWADTDGDGYGDNYTYSLSNSTMLRVDQNGDAFTNDPTQWSDFDGDGYGDNAVGSDPDAFPNDPTQWADADQDGLGDNQSGNNPDPFLGDSDNDGFNNSVDQFPWNPTQWEDGDNDGLGDNPNGTAADPYPDDTDNDGFNNSVDPFPFDPTQWSDEDGDGLGDNPNGTNADPSLGDTDNDGYNNSADHFPFDPTQQVDSDGDGYGDNQSGFNPDEFPANPSQWADTDADGYGDNPHGTNGDAFPNDPTQWSDYDGDGFGDNPTGNLPDSFPHDPDQWQDLDGDGHGDNYVWVVDNATGLRTQFGDAFPGDATQWSDLDGDGFGDNYVWVVDNATGLRTQFGDAFPGDATQWSDLDGDGFGDNYSFDTSQVTLLRENQNGDAFPYDPTQWSDLDGDGYGDNSSGANPDWNPFDPTQWVDADGDGLGDNPLGNNPDPTPGDGDNDGVIDLIDAFPDDPYEVFDTDGDGIGDNADTDDDNDGWDDSVEIQCSTSPLSPNSTPMDSDQDGLCNWNDVDDDSDGFEDAFDGCPTVFGNSTYDLLGCPDSDGDSVADLQDSHPLNPYLSIDSDSDGYPDPIDLFPNDATQWADFDSDGYGDNQQGNNPDPYLDDSDNDGVINQLDPFPTDSTQWKDEDRDGLGDNPEGSNPDPYPSDTDNDGVPNDSDVFRFDPTQWSDTDGDGYGDNPLGNNGDSFYLDPTQCCDRDGDGWGDNPNGTNPDQFPDEFTQWVDLDGDGLGDNPSGANGDPFPNDSDNDGVNNLDDFWPDDPERSLDWDGDNVSQEEEGVILDRVPRAYTQWVIGGLLASMAIGVSIGAFIRIGRAPRDEL